MTTQPITTPADARRRRISRLEDLITRAYDELVDLRRTEARITGVEYTHPHRAALAPVRPVPPAREARDYDNPAAGIPGKIIRAWALAEGLVTTTRTGQIPRDLRYAYDAAGRPGWPPPPDTAPTTAQIRAWCREQGMEVPDRGTLPHWALASYDHAHQPTT